MDYTGFTSALLLLGLGLFILKIRKNIFSPDVFFCFLWGITCFLAALHLYGMFQIRNFCYILCLFGSFSFVIGTYCSNYLKVSSFPKKNVYFNENLFFGICLFIIVYEIPELIQSIQLQIRGVDLYQIREASFGMTDVYGYHSKSNINSLISFFLRPLKDILIVVSINHFFCSNGRLIFLWLPFSMITIDSLSTGSRFVIAYFIIEFLSCFFIYKHYFYSKLKKKAILWCMGFTIVPSLLIIIVSMLRAALGTTIHFGNMFYFYLSGCLPFCDILLKKIECMDFYTMSCYSLFGIWSQLLNIVCTALQFEKPQIYTESLNLIVGMQKPQEIANNQLFNAFTTPFLPLYYDWRYTGVFVGMFFFGFITQYSYKRCIQTFSPYTMTFYLIAMHYVFKSIHQFPLTSLTCVDAILFLVLIKFFKIPII